MTENAQRLQLYLTAEAKILGGQAYRMGERELRMADLAEVRREIARLQTLVAREAPGRATFGTADFGGTW